MSHDWLSPDAVAVLANINPRNVRKAISRGNWRGQKLVIKEEVCVGGASGKRYLVRADSLPEDIARKHYGHSLEAVLPEPLQLGKVLVASGLEDIQIKAQSQVGAKTQKALQKLAIVRQVESQSDCHARAEKVTELATMFGLAEQTIYKWLGKARNGGVSQLAKQGRKDAGKRRTTITRAWDKAIGEHISGEKSEEISAAVERYVSSLWADGARSWQTVNELGSARLVELSQEVIKVEARELAEYCKLGRRYVDRYKDYRVLGVLRHDAKRGKDLYQPTIRRNADGLAPMDVVVGDVTPLDVLFDRGDGGQPSTWRAISWLDVATNRLYMSLYLPPRGKSVTRIQVAASFASMVEAWGLPSTLYLDNGSEYKWDEMMTGYHELATLSKSAMVVQLLDRDKKDRPLSPVFGKLNSVLRAKAYNANAKPIESIFAGFNKILAEVPGYIGGDRMKAKTKNVGKKPSCFTGDENDFSAAIETCLAAYHNRPQSGRLNGKSPNELYREHINAGWEQTQVAREVLLLSFADEQERAVRQGRIRWSVGKQLYYYTDDALLPYSTQKVRVRVARHDPRVAFVFAPGQERLLCVAEQETTYGFLDARGADEAARRQQVFAAWVAEKRRDCDRIVLLDERRRANALMHEEAPIAPVGSEIQIPELAEMLGVANARLTAADDEVRMPLDLSQWNVDDSPEVARYRRLLAEEEPKDAEYN